MHGARVQLSCEAVILSQYGGEQTPCALLVTDDARLLIVYDEAVRGAIDLRAVVSIDESLDDSRLVVLVVGRKEPYSPERWSFLLARSDKARLIDRVRRVK